MMRNSGEWVVKSPLETSLWGSIAKYVERLSALLSGCQFWWAPAKHAAEVMRWASDRPGRTGCPLPGVAANCARPLRQRQPPHSSPLLSLRPLPARCPSLFACPRMPITDMNVYMQAGVGVGGGGAPASENTGGGGRQKNCLQCTAAKWQRRATRKHGLFSPAALLGRMNELVGWGGST